MITFTSTFFYYTTSLIKKHIIDLNIQSKNELHRCLIVTITNCFAPSPVFLLNLSFHLKAQKLGEIEPSEPVFTSLESSYRSSLKLASSSPVSGLPSQKGAPRPRGNPGPVKPPAKADLDKEELLILKRLPANLPKRSVDFYITNKTDFKAQFER